MVLEKVSVIIATYNSEKTLEKVLAALRDQDYPQELMEILLIDGGSTDSTFDIAEKYGCTVVNNPKTEPIYAKMLGVQAASGSYLMTLDHDEVLEDKESVTRRIKLLENDSKCKVAFCSGYKRPTDYPLLNQYISEFGDPFSLYMYYFSKDWNYYERALKKCCKLLEETDDYIKVSFESLKKDIIIELCCLATIIDLEYFKSTLRIDESEDRFVQCFYLMLENGDYEAVLTKNDPLVHYSVDSVKAYFPKLKWRIMNNIYFADKGKSGFSGRELHQKSARFKKYGFILYSFFVPICLTHALLMAVTRKNWVYILHPVFCLYVSIEILFQLLLKKLGYTPKLKSYDGKKVIG